MKDFQKERNSALEKREKEKKGTSASNAMAGEGNHKERKKNTGQTCRLWVGGSLKERKEREKKSLVLTGGGEGKDGMGLVRLTGKGRKTAWRRGGDSTGP